jgi:phosphoglycolate phosphatase
VTSCASRATPTRTSTPASTTCSRGTCATSRRRWRGGGGRREPPRGDERRSPPPRVYEGVEALLDALEARDDVTLGLLTGNIEAGARIKLAAVGIDFERFEVNAFGSDHELRPELPAVAQRRAHAHLGYPLPGSSVVVIGDTPADIACGRGIGARAIAVATGRFGVDELARHAPAAVFESLADTDAVLDAILSPDACAKSS